MSDSKASTTFNNHRPQASRSYFSRPSASRRRSESVIPDAQHYVKYPDVDQVKRVRAEVIHEHPERRWGGASQRAFPTLTRKTQSDSKTHTMRDTYTTVREVRREPGSEHRHRHRSRRDEDFEHKGEAHTHRAERGSSHVGDRDRSRDRRGSRTRHEATRSKREASHRANREPSRRGSNHRSSRHEVERHRDDSRNERRSVVEASPPHTREGPSIGRASSVRESTVASILRPLLGRSPSVSRPPLSRPPPTIRATTTVIPKSPPPRSQTHSNIKRASSRPRVPSAGSRPSGILAALTSPKPVEKKDTDCSFCLSTFVASKCPRVKCRKECTNRLCYSCLRQSFENSLTNSANMPPKCCGNGVIPTKVAEKLFDDKFRKQWNQKCQEATSHNSKYCPNRKCGKFIPDDCIFTDKNGGATHGRKYGRCPSCQTKCCYLCNNKWHKTQQCPKDDATKAFLDMKKEQGWQTCSNCGLTMERISGCNHMSCFKCQHEFCMICGRDWNKDIGGCGKHKTFDLEDVNEQRERDLRGEYARWPDDVLEDIPGGDPFYNPDRRRMADMLNGDHDMAMRMQAILGFGGPPRQTTIPAPPPIVLNANSMPRVADFLSAPPPPMPPRQANIQNVRDQPQPFLQRTRSIQQPLRPNSMASRQNSTRPFLRPSERVVPRRQPTNDYAAEAEMHRPITGEARASMLAGITRGQTGDSRVDEWRQHVDPVG